MLEARGIDFSYPTGRTLYHQFSLSVAPGERVALQAPSGFGKTTLCRILAGYLQPTAGQITVDGEPLPKQGIKPVQMVLQHPETAVDPRMRMQATLAEAGIVCGSDRIPTSQEHRRLLEILGIRREWLARFPHELSGGELQRFCIARALATKPRYLIADEMTTMLDAETQALIWHATIAEAERLHMGLVFVSHSPALTKRIATRVVQLA